MTPDVTPLLTWSYTIWHTFLILMWMAGLGLMAWTLRQNNKRWSVLCHLITLFGICTIAFNTVALLNIWTPGLIGATFYLPPKFIMAGLSLIIAISIIVLLPGWSINIIPPRRRKRNTNEAIRLNTESLKKNNRLTEQIQSLQAELGTRTQSILESMSAISSSTPISKQAIARITCHLYQITRSQERLMNNKWRGILLRECIKEQLEAFDLEQHATLNGPDITLNTDQTQSFFMGLFELCLNSIWHAQKSGQQARYTIKWGVIPSGSALSLEFVWQEERLDNTPSQEYNVVLEYIVPNAFQGEGKLVCTKESVTWTLIGILDETALYHKQKTDEYDYPRVLRGLNRELEDA